MAKNDLKIYEDSSNYTCQVIKLPAKVPIKGLDNLVEVNYQGNSVLIGKDSPEDELYLFFPSECQISHEFLSKNNLYRHETLNSDPTKKGFFEDSRRVKAIKFKGIISSGFIIPIESLGHVTGGPTDELATGNEFNEFHGLEICRKYVRKRNQSSNTPGEKKQGILDRIVERKMVPEHPDTSHLMRNLHRFNPDTQIVVSYKLHGTSARTYNTLVKKKQSLKNRIAKYFGVSVVEQVYENVACSRRQVKSVGFEELPNKNHFFTDGDLWSKWAKNNLEGKLNQGEAVYYEIVGTTYTGSPIQDGYSYQLTEPIGYIYRISNINPQGIEIDLSHDQMEERAKQLGIKTVPVLFKGTLGEFISKYDTGQSYVDLEEPMTRIFYNNLLEKPSILDASVVEEGFCVKIDGSYPKTETFKIKSKLFLAHESKSLDKEVVDIEEEQNQKDEGNN